MQFNLPPSHYKEQVKIHKHQKYLNMKESDKCKLHETKHKDQYHSSDSGSSVNKHKTNKKERVWESHNVYHKLNKLLEDIGTLSDSSKSSGERKASIISIKSEILTEQDHIDFKLQNNKLNAASFKERPKGEQESNHSNLPTKTHSKKKILHTYNETETRPQLYTINGRDSLEGHTKIKKKKKRHQTDSESDIAKKESKSNHIINETKIKNKIKHPQAHFQNNTESNSISKAKPHCANDNNKKRSGEDSDHIKVKKKKKRHQTNSDSDDVKDILTKNTGNESKRPYNNNCDLLTSSDFLKKQLIEIPRASVEKDVKKKKKRLIETENHTEIDSRSNRYDTEQSHPDSNHIKIKKKKKRHTDSTSDSIEIVSKKNKVNKEKESPTKNSVEQLENETKIKKKKKHSTENSKNTVNDNSNHTKTKKKDLLEENRGARNFLAEMGPTDENSFDYDSLKDAIEFNDNRLSEEHKVMLSQLVVQLPWPVPPSHLVETRMSTHPLKEQQEILKQEFKMQTTKYTPEEDNRIKRNWNKFCELHLIPNDPKPFLAFEALRNSKIKGSVLSKSQRINFVRFLGHRLSHRCLFSVYRRFKKLFTKNIKGRFSAAEDNIILNYTKKSREPNKFAQLAVILNRDRHAIMLRHKTLLQRTYDKGGYT